MVGFPKRNGRRSDAALLKTGGRDFPKGKPTEKILSLEEGLSGPGSSSSEVFQPGNFRIIGCINPVI